MSSAKGKLVRLLGGAFLRRASVASAEDVGGFRHVVLRGDMLKPGAGTKLQILLPSDDMRTYTPIASTDGVALLGWKHAMRDAVRRAARSVSACASDRVTFNGTRKRSASLRLSGATVYVPELVQRRLRCGGCRLDWTRRPRSPRSTRGRAPQARASGWCGPCGCSP